MIETLRWDNLLPILRYCCTDTKRALELETVCRLFSDIIRTCLYKEVVPHCFPIALKQAVTSHWSADDWRKLAVDETCRWRNVINGKLKPNKLKRRSSHVAFEDSSTGLVIHNDEFWNYSIKKGLAKKTGKTEQLEIPSYQHMACEKALYAVARNNTRLVTSSNDQPTRTVELPAEYGILPSKSIKLICGARFGFLYPSFFFFPIPMHGSGWFRAQSDLVVRFELANPANQDVYHITPRDAPLDLVNSINLVDNDELLIGTSWGRAISWKAQEKTPQIALNVCPNIEVMSLSRTDEGIICVGADKSLYLVHQKQTIPLPDSDQTPVALKQALIISPNKVALLFKSKLIIWDWRASRLDPISCNEDEFIDMTLLERNILFVRQRRLSITTPMDNFSEYRIFDCRSAEVKSWCWHERWDHLETLEANPLMYSNGTLAICNLICNKTLVFNFAGKHLSQNHNESDTTSPQGRGKRRKITHQHNTLTQT